MGGRVVEGTGLENRQAGNRLVGSNPTPSANCTVHGAIVKEAARTIPVHALDDPRVHLAPPHHGRLRQGRLRTLCGLQAVSELPLFAMVETKQRCRKRFALAATSGMAAEG